MARCAASGVPGGGQVARYRRVAVSSLPKAAVLLTVITAALVRVVRALVNAALSPGDGDGKIRATQNRSGPMGAAALRERGDPLAAYQCGRQATVARPVGGLSEESERLITTRPGAGLTATSYGCSASDPEAEPEDRAARPGGSTRY